MLLQGQYADLPLDADAAMPAALVALYRFGHEVSPVTTNVHWT
jgi:hypothetical protein